MSIAKGIVKTAENVVKMNADTMQIFSRNPRGSNYKDPTVKEAEEFQMKPILLLTTRTDNICIPLCRCKVL